MESSIVLDSVFVKLRHCIARLRVNTLRDLFLAFESLPKEENGLVTDDAFETALNDCGLFLTKSAMWQMKRHFGEESHLDCMKIFNAIRGELNEERKAIISHLFNHLSTGEETVALETIFEKYNVNNNPRVISGMTSAVRSEAQFKQSFNQYPDNMVITDFLDAFANMGAYYLDDNLFASIVNKCFSIDVSKSTGAACDPISEVRGFLEEKLRQRSRGNESFMQTLLRVFKFFDLDQNGSISFNEFGRVFERLGLLLTQETLEALWKQSDVDANGRVDFKEWSRLILESH